MFILQNQRDRAKILCWWGGRLCYEKKLGGFKS